VPCGTRCIAAGACCAAPEDCFNGVDDDCDGNADCADSDCQVAAMCVPDPGSFQVMVQLTSAQAACPSSYPGNRQILRTANPSAHSCDATSCRLTGVIECNDFQIHTWSECPDVPDEDFSAHDSRCRMLCESGGLTRLPVTLPRPFDMTESGSGGTVKCGILQSPDPNQPRGVFDVYGLDVTGGSESRRECVLAAGSGAPTLPPVSMARETAFCATSQSSHAGCSGGGLCVPRPAAQICAVASGAQNCPIGYSQRDDQWFTSYTDGRSCAACSAGAIGGGCPAGISAGSEGSCSDQAFMAGAGRYCPSGNVPYYLPWARDITPAVAPSCGAPHSDVAGSLVPTGQHTVCCL
jgi:hypothetical protein